MKKITKLNLAVFFSVIVMIAFTAYFYLPAVLGDTVYPLKYEEEIVKWSEAHKLDPALAAAVIMQESRFNPAATSYKGARGLMQIMPATAQTIAKGVEVSNYSLYDAETSIQFGTWHLHVMLEKYDNNVDAALAAYNAGGGNADKWIRLGILDSIPFNETRNYVINVKRYREIYASMYSDELGITGTEYEVNLDENKNEPKLHSDFWGMFFERYFGKFIDKEEDTNNDEV